MDSIGETKTNSKSNEGFVHHVFNFDEDSKHEIMNIVQYSVLAIIPVIMLNKTIQRFVPDVDEEKGTPEILAEVIFQVMVMFLGILIIHRIISYVPTYSEESYAKLNVTSLILGFLVIVLSLQTKLGEKTNVLLDRLYNIIYGETTLKDDKKGPHKNVVKVTQPLTGMTHQPSRADQRDNANSQYPSTLGDMAQQTAPNFNTMYSGPNTGMPGAATPGGEGMDSMLEPEAANSVLGGGGFGSAF
jgi:hypothetical protein